MAGWSPGMSETSNDTTFAGWAREASRPPVIYENCLRMATFITRIGAPQPSKARGSAPHIICQRHARQGRRQQGRCCAAADKRNHQITPPEKFSTTAISLCVAARPFSSGTGSGRLQHVNMPARHSEAVTGHDNIRKRAVAPFLSQLLKRRHLGAPLPAPIMTVCPLSTYLAKGRQQTPQISRRNR